MKNVLLTFFLLSFISLKTIAQIPSPVIPEFKFFRMDQSVFTDKDLAKGKKIFFVFFDPTCDHCQRAMKIIGAQYKNFKNAAIYLIAIDSPDKINSFMDKYGQPLKGKKNILLLQDKLNQFIVKFKPKKYPSMFLYSAQKKLIAYEDEPEAINKIIKPLSAK